MYLSQIRFLNGGYCWQFSRLAGAASWKPRKFYALFLSFVHPQHGLCLIDTGYGPAVRSVAKTVAGFVPSLAIPIPRRQVFDLANYPEGTHGIRPQEVQRIFVSHFHADHIGGTQLFPEARFVYRPDSLTYLMQLNFLQQASHGFFSGFLPTDFTARGETIAESSFVEGSAPLPSLPTFDFFGDGTLLLIDLPGHAVGHTGYLLRTGDSTSIFYIVDAFWDRQAWEQQNRLPWISRFITSDYKAYLSTQDRLRTIAAHSSLVPIACHCPWTQDYVAASTT